MKLTLTHEEAQDMIKDYLADRPSICPQVVEIKEDASESTIHRIHANVLEEHLKNLLHEPNKIYRIKYIRTVTGLGLRDAKELDERIFSK